MTIQVVIAILGFSLSLIVNIVAIAFFAGSLSATQKFINEKFEDFKKATAEHFKRLEEKQDKHNNLISRVAVLENSSQERKGENDEIFQRLRSGGI